MRLPRRPSLSATVRRALLLGGALAMASAAQAAQSPQAAQDAERTAAQATPPATVPVPALSAVPAPGDAQASPLPDEPSPDGLPQRLVLALDGVPYGMFAQLQAEGHFADYGPAARMVSSFPSLSGVSFAAIGGGAIPEGYQEMRYDPDTNQVVGNTLYTLSGRAHQNLPADNSPHSLTHRVVGYMAPYTMAMRDLARIREELLASRKAGFVAYLAQSDVILHVDGADAGRAFLVDLEAWLAALQAEVRARTGRDLLVDLVSDHGSTLVKGRQVNLPRQLKHCGYRRNDTIDGPRDVAYSLAGIIGSVAVTARPESVEPVAACLAAAEGVDLVAVDRGDRVGLLAADGREAEVRLLPGAPERYAYRSVQGDPLGLFGAEVVAPGTEREYEAEAQFRASLDTKYPDALRRVWRAFHGSVQDPSPILLSLADGREAGYRTVRSLAWLRGRGGTHGSLTAAASLGVIASNWRAVDDVDCWQAREALFGEATRVASRTATPLRTAIAASASAAPANAGAVDTPAEAASAVGVSAPAGLHTAAQPQR
jgi:hypothetical protein